MCTPRERSVLRIPQNAEHIKWTTEGTVKGWFCPAEYSVTCASVNCRDMSVSGECAVALP